MDKLLSLLQRLFDEEQIIQMVFGGVRKKSSPCRKVTLRPVLLRDELHYQAEYHYEKKVTHENLNAGEALELCLRLISEEFKQLNLFCGEADYQVLSAKPERPRITKQKATKTKGVLSHNQEKRYIIPDGTPCDFLIRLGVMTKDGQVIQKHYNKFRQINRFLEIISDVIEYLPVGGPAGSAVSSIPGAAGGNAPRGSENISVPGGSALSTKGCGGPIKIIDFGCGKAYLTFALYYYLKLQLGRNVDIVGLDLKQDVIDFCSAVAKDLNYDGLRFEMGDIAEYDDTARADMVVTLHACDTATDFALIKAVNWNASIILSVPCCQHELFGQIKNDVNAPILKQGILKERFSAILTDALRALKLEEHGYEVSMIEFTSLEHTAKNIMLRCVRGQSAARKSAGTERVKAREEYERLKAFWNVSPTIDQMN